VRGLTLLEILITLVIIVILTSLVLNSEKTRPQTQKLLLERELKTATRELWILRMDNPNQDAWAWVARSGQSYTLDRKTNKVVPSTKEIQ